MRVWIDQDLCTGDGLCTDHCPEVFTMLEDGLSYVHEADVACNDPGGYASAIRVPVRHEAEVILAAEDCPGECIFLEGDLVQKSVDDPGDDIVDDELIDAAVP